MLLNQKERKLAKILMPTTPRRISRSVSGPSHIEVKFSKPEIQRLSLPKRPSPRSDTSEKPPHEIIKEKKKPSFCKTN